MLWLRACGSALVIVFVVVFATVTEKTSGREHCQADLAVEVRRGTLPAG